MRHRTLFVPLLLILLVACDDPDEIAQYESATRKLQLQSEEREDLLRSKDVSLREHALNLTRLQELRLFTDAASFLVVARKSSEEQKASMEVVEGTRADGIIRWKARGPVENTRGYSSGPSGLEIIPMGFTVVKQLTFDASQWTAEGDAYPFPAPCNAPRWMVNDGDILLALHLRVAQPLLEGDRQKAARSALEEARRRFNEVDNQMKAELPEYLPTRRCVREALHGMGWATKQPSALWIAYTIFDGHVRRPPLPSGTIRVTGEQVVFEGKRPRELQDGDIAGRLPAGWSVVESEPGGRLVIGRGS